MPLLVSPYFLHLYTFVHVLHAYIRTDLRIHTYISMQFTYLFSFCSLDISHFQKLSEESSLEFDFHWNSLPKAIGELHILTTTGTRYKKPSLSYIL